MWLTHPFYHTMPDIDFIALYHIWRTFPVISRKIDLIEREKKTHNQWAPFTRIIWFSKWNMQILCQCYLKCLHRQITFSKLHTFFFLFVLLFWTESIYIQTNSFLKEIPWNLWKKISPQQYVPELIRYVKSAKK